MKTIKYLDKEFEIMNECGYEYKSSQTMTINACFIENGVYEILQIYMTYYKPMNKVDIKYNLIIVPNHVLKSMLLKGGAENE